MHRTNGSGYYNQISIEISEKTRRFEIMAIHNHELLGVVTVNIATISMIREDICYPLLYNELKQILYPGLKAKFKIEHEYLQQWNIKDGDVIVISTNLVDTNGIVIDTLFTALEYYPSNDIAHQVDTSELKCTHSSLRMNGCKTEVSQKISLTTEPKLK
ncbi:MAG: hypothetical protein K2Y14_05450 [Burkholderiales bacterium]|nr:hypothetical protein [Burkholderiales bacterium]